MQLTGLRFALAHTGGTESKERWMRMGQAASLGDLKKVMASAEVSERTSPFIPFLACPCALPCLALLRLACMFPCVRYLLHLCMCIPLQHLACVALLARYLDCITLCTFVRAFPCNTLPASAHIALLALPCLRCRVCALP
eukprot:140780-Pelagomonas_calceolata.AAC.1